MQIGGQRCPFHREIEKDLTSYLLSLAPMNEKVGEEGQESIPVDDTAIGFFAITHSQ